MTLKISSKSVQWTLINRRYRVQKHCFEKKQFKVSRKWKTEEDYRDQTIIPEKIIEI